MAAKVKALIVTLGGEGSDIYVDGKVIKVASVKPDAILDPTGCGDAYRAGLLYGISSWLGLAEDRAACFAAWARSKLPNAAPKITSPRVTNLHNAINRPSAAPSGKPMMKTTALLLSLVATLGLSACAGSLSNSAYSRDQARGEMSVRHGRGRERASGAD